MEGLRVLLWFIGTCIINFEWSLFYVNLFILKFELPISPKKVSKPTPHTSVLLLNRNNTSI
jgi:hypothetical protein